MIKAVIFDCFGVLTTDLLMEFTASLSEEIMPRIHEIIHKRGAGLISREEFVDSLTEITGQSREYIETVSRPGGIKNVKLLAYIRKLKSKGLKIGLLSNVGSNWVRDEFLTNKEQKLFNDILLSYEVNLVKPDPEIFNLAAERLRVDIAETILIDDIERYCQAAKSEGMQAIVYKNFPQMKRELEKLLAKT